ncbi:MAG: NAD(P)-dependent oxidoreductase [Rhodospirillaceae bacterium]|jgi:nucleoside-diphosphate-sugar epimerase|nr:NAD(P)-dependent oxidoreductase [Rhodospirillaceae bacterium]
MAKVLVVGGAGYIGGALTDQLIDAGHDVRIFDNLLFEERYLKPVEFIFGDVRDAAALKPHMNWADTVVWLVGLVGDGACSLYPRLTEELNIESVNWLVRNFDRRIIFMSTCSVYGAQDGILTEESPFDPLSLYARSKVEGEKILGDRAIYFRLGTLFGLGDTYSRIRLDLVLNLLTVKGCLYKRMSVYGGNQWRPLLHVRDVAGAVVKNVDSTLVGPYNLHTENLMITDLAERIQKYVPDATVEKTTLKFEDSRNYKVSSDKARNTFGFDPQLTPDDGIQEIQRLVTQGRVQDASSPRYSNTDFLRPLFAPQQSPLGGEIIPPVWQAR